MSALNASITSTSLDAERRSHEPSMEEILASIRRIIADDDALPVVRREREREKEKRPPPIESPRHEEPAPRAAAPVPTPEPRRPSVVALSQAAEPEPSSAPIVEPEAAQQASDYWLRNHHAAAEDLATTEDETTDDSGHWAVAAEQDALGQDALGLDEFEATDETHDEAVDEQPAHVEDVAETEASAPLVSTDAANSIASHFEALAASIVISESALVERYARDLLRPMLKQWLDDNLPHIVERLVRAEIERVARGRR
jgi:hypothetical protein